MKSGIEFSPLGSQLLQSKLPEEKELRGADRTPGDPALDEFTGSCFSTHNPVEGGLYARSPWERAGSGLLELWCLISVHATCEAGFHIAIIAK